MSNAMEAQLARFGRGRPARTYPNPTCLACGTAFKPGQRTRPGPEGPGTLCERCWGRSRRGLSGATSKPILLFSLRDAEHRSGVGSPSFVPSLPLDSQHRDASPSPPRPPPRPRKRTGAGKRPAVAAEPPPDAPATRLTHAEMEDRLFEQADEISRLKCEMERLLDDVFELKRRLDGSAAEATED